ncbi:hypothetical protein EON80_22910 [bacterium]|nr:MAG: hypothetical protein EON80_22910 [bacterium]
MAGAEGFDPDPVPSNFKRSWKKGTRAEGTYEASFEFEGATVFINGLGKPAKDALAAEEKRLFEAGQEFQAEVEERMNIEREKLAARAKLKPPIPAEQLESERVEEEALAESWKQRQAELDGAQLALMESVVFQAVVGWENAPIAYEPGALEELPSEMVAAWAEAIIEKTRLSSAEARFLARK